MDEAQHQRFSAIAHGEMAIMNPLSPETIERAVEAVDLPAGARILDLGCGKAELLARLVERFDARGVGVEQSPQLLPVARRRAAGPAAGTMEILEGDARTYAAEEPFDLVVCIGPGWEHGGFGALLRFLEPHVAPNGELLVADGYWRTEPSAEYLALLGARRDEMTTHDLNSMAGVDLGMQPLWSGSATQQDWDRYEFGYFATVDRWAAAHPDDPDRDAFTTQARRVRDRYLRGGRDCLGFGIYLFRVP
jgi:cyclopropane fatty-acyl-phospholipid synthase-like methyltransferase